MKNNNFHQFHSRKQIMISVLFTILIVNTSLFRVNAQYADMQVYNETIVSHNQTITFIFHFPEQINLSTNNRFDLNISVDTGYLIIEYFQVLIEGQNNIEHIQFLQIMGVPVSPTGLYIPLSLNSSREVQSIANTSIRFKLGYSLNATLFEQFTSSKDENYVQILGNVESDLDTEGTGLWFLFWEFPTIWSAIVVYGLVIVVALFAFFNFRNKRKKINKKENEKKLEQSVDKLE